MHIKLVEDINQGQYLSINTIGYMYAKLILFHQLLTLLPQQHNRMIIYHFWYM